MRIHIDLPLHYRMWISIRECRNVAREALEASQDDNPEISLVFTNNRKIRKLNSTYRKINSPTDVLSFQTNEKTESGTYLGDVVISVPKAVEQAKRNKHSVKAEIFLLIVHGILHLQGYDDQNKKLKNTMWVKQAEILGKLGIDPRTLNI